MIMARDAGRSWDYDAKERNAMSARFYRNPLGRGFSGGLPCQAPSKGDQPFASSPFAHLIPQSLRRASGDLFSGSLNLPALNHRLRKRAAIDMFQLTAYRQAARDPRD